VVRNEEEWIRYKPKREERSCVDGVYRPGLLTKILCEKIGQIDGVTRAELTTKHVSLKQDSYNCFSNCFWPISNIVEETLDCSRELW
jgi:hypothetical protein